MNSGTQSSPYAQQQVSYMRLLYFPFVLMAFVFHSCEVVTGETVGRLQVDTVSTEDHLISRSAMVDLRKGDELGLWAQMDLSYDVEPRLYFQVQLLLDTVLVHEVLASPFAAHSFVRVKETNVDGRLYRSFMARCGGLDITADGTYRINTRLVCLSDLPIDVRKATLILRK